MTAITGPSLRRGPTAERFRASPWGGTYRLKDVLAVADELANELPRTDEVHGFLDLLSKATTIER